MDSTNSTTEEKCFSPFHDDVVDDEEKSKGYSKINSNDNELLSLRRKLDRRSFLFDMLQKAYHRDVIVIKEALFRSTEQPDITAASTTINCNNDKRKVVELQRQLQTVPSTDIRPFVASFDLFAPTECELRCKPCDQCGGSLEIVHKECEVFETLKQQLAELQMRVECLQQELVETKNQALQERIDFTAREKEATETRMAMEQTISSLKQNISTNEDLVKRAKNFEQARCDMEKTIADWKNRCQMEEESKAICLEQNQLHLTMLKREKEEICHQLRKFEAERTKEFLTNKKLTTELERSKEEITAWIEANDDLKNQINQGTFQRDIEKEEIQRLQHQLTQAQRNEELLLQKLSRLEANQHETLDQAEIKYEKLQHEMKLLQKEFLSEKSLQKRHFLSQIRAINQQHGEELASKNEEICQYRKEASAKEQEWRAMLESIVCAAKILTDGCIQQRQLLQKEGWYDANDAAAVVVEDHVDSNIVISLDILERKKILKMLEELIFGISGEFQSEAGNILDKGYSIQWEALLSNDGRKDIINFLKLVFNKNMWSTKALVDHLHTDTEIRIKEMQSLFEKERLTMQEAATLKAEEVKTMIEQKNNLYQKSQSGLFSLMQQLDAAQKEYLVLQDKYKGEQATATNLELKVIQSTAAFEELQKEHSLANEQIYDLMEEVERSNQEKELYRMACDDSDAKCHTLCQTLFEIHTKEMERLQTNISIEIQCACYTKDAAVQVDLVSSLPFTLNPYFTANNNNNNDKPPLTVPLAYFTTPTTLPFRL